MKVVINTCYGGFDLSNEATTILALHGVEVDKIDSHDTLRSYQDVVEVVELLGSLATTRSYGRSQTTSTGIGSQPSVQRRWELRSLRCSLVAQGNTHFRSSPVDLRISPEKGEADDRMCEHICSR